MVIKGSGKVLSEMELVKEVATDVGIRGGRMFYVGGCVRDEYIGKPSKDIDVEIYGLTYSELEDLLGKFGPVMTVGKAFGVLMVKGYDIDFALPRKETKVGKGYTGFDVEVDPYISYELALARRDFTMNALLKDVLTGEVLDPYNGLEDIENKRIRVVNEKTFIEDELRVFRACQFASRFGFDMDEKVIELSKTFDYNLSPERMYVEFNKGLMKSKRPSVFFDNLRKTGAIDNYPELVSLIGCEQNPEFHPEGDVWNHTMEVLDRAAKLKDQANNPLAFMYGVLCHDMGKPATTKLYNGRIVSHGHEDYVEPALNFIERLTNEKIIKSVVEEIVKNHMVVHQLVKMKDSRIRNWMVGKDVKNLLLMGYADNGVDSEYHANIKKIKSLSIGGFGKVEPYLMGKDLVEMGFKPGPNLGKILAELYTLELNGNSKDQVLEQAYRMYFKENHESVLAKYEQLKLEKYGLRALKWKKRFEELYDKPFVIYKRFVFTPYGIVRVNGKEHLNMFETNEDLRLSIIKSLSLPDKLEEKMLSVYKNLR